MNYDFYKVRAEIYVTSGNKTLLKMKYNTSLNIDIGTIHMNICLLYTM